jgi:hypothetical protein
MTEGMTFHGAGVQLPRGQADIGRWIMPLHERGRLRHANSGLTMPSDDEGCAANRSSKEFDSQTEDTRTNGAAQSRMEKRTSFGMSRSFQVVPLACSTQPRGWKRWPHLRPNSRRF